jgi:hypothetical protein
VKTFYAWKVLYKINKHVIRYFIFLNVFMECNKCIIILMFHAFWLGKWFQEKNNAWPINCFKTFTHNYTSSTEQPLSCDPTEIEILTIKTRFFPRISELVNLVTSLLKTYLTWTGSFFFLFHLTEHKKSFKYIKGIEFHWKS